MKKVVLAINSKYIQADWSADEKSSPVFQSRKNRWMIDHYNEIDKFIFVVEHTQTHIYILTYICDLKSDFKKLTNQFTC